MRIAVDARELTGRPTGVGRYLTELLSAWSQDPRAAGTTVTLFAPRALHAALPLDAPRAVGATTEVVVLEGGSGTGWEQLTLPRALRGRADVLFAPGYSAPLLAPVPTVVAIHDVSFCAHPEWYRWREGARRRWTVRLTARRAARIVTISRFSRDEIVRLLGVPAARVLVTPLAPGRPRGHDGAAGASRREGRDPLVLYVGSLLNRRHVPALVRAFRTVADRLPDARLAIVGENRTFPFEDPERVARELGIAGRVDMRAYVPDAELAGLYARAAAFAFLSTYEGFGLTPVEAMAAGVPVVTADTPVAREIYGNAAIYVDPGDTAAVAAALVRVMLDEGERARLLEAGAAVVGGMSWTETARATLDAIEAAGRS